MGMVERAFDRIVDLLAVVAALLLIAVMLATVFKVALAASEAKGSSGSIN